MSHYIDLYHNTYASESLNATQHIKNKLISFKTKKRSFTKVYNLLINEFSDIKAQVFINNNLFKKLLLIFKNRVSEYEEEYQYLILENEIKSNYYSNCKIDYEVFIKALAKHEAYHHIINCFRNYNMLYHFMYKLNKFEGFKNLNSFQIIHYSKSQEDTELYEELRNLFDKPNNHSTNKTISNNINKSGGTDVNQKKKSQNFELKEPYSKNLQPLFTYMKDKNIIIENSHYSDFENIFLRDWNQHNSTLIIQNNREFSLILQEIRFAFSNLSDVSAGKSKLISSTKTIISRDNFAGSRKWYKKEYRNSNNLSKYYNDNQINYIENAKKCMEILKKDSHLK